MKILIANPIQKQRGCNKDLNGGYGTQDDIGDSLLSRLISRKRKDLVKIPVLALADISAILKDKGADVLYSEDFENCLDLARKGPIDIAILYGSIVNANLENDLISAIQRQQPHIKTIVVGPFGSKFPDAFPEADCVIIGEPEAFFQDWSLNMDRLESSRCITSEPLHNLDVLPTIDFSEMNFSQFSYRPMLPKPTGFIEASRGCPYSCGYYCTYGENQGKLIRSYSAKRVVEDMVALSKRYGFKSYQFRDPVFGLEKGFIDSFCAYLADTDADFTWGIETRLDVLSSSNLTLMHAHGLRSINVGIETSSDAVAKSNKRFNATRSHQEEILDVAHKLGIKVNAFYIIGLEDDTYNTCLETIHFACRQKTFLSRFSVCTPYPGTDFYKDLLAEGRILGLDLDKHNQYQLTFKHNNLDQRSVRRLLDIAHQRYYLRPKKLLSVIKGLIETR